MNQLFAASEVVQQFLSTVGLNIQKKIYYL